MSWYAKGWTDYPCWICGHRCFNHADGLYAALGGDLELHSEGCKAFLYPNGSSGYWCHCVALQMGDFTQ